MRCCLAVLFSTLAILAVVGRADDVKFYEQNGVTYQETHQVVQRPISETHYQDQQRTVYVEQYKTQNQPLQQTFQTPVTVYTMETYWVNRWNPFSEPYLAYRYVPHTHWETARPNGASADACARSGPPAADHQDPGDDAARRGRRAYQPGAGRLAAGNQPRSVCPERRDRGAARQLWRRQPEARRWKAIRRGRAPLGTPPTARSSVEA